MRRPLIAGNWKMNGAKVQVTQLLEALKQGCEHVETAELAVFPPFPYLSLCEELLLRSQITWGGQNVSAEKEGAFTGEVSVDMLLDFNCSYAIIGHSERRLLYQETDEMIAKKAKVCLQSGLVPIVCIGETKQQRDDQQTLAVIEKQLAAVLALNDNQNALAAMVIAYEPVWAIGTGEVASPDQAQEVHAFIRQQMEKHHQLLAANTRVIYGGSVKPDNAADLLSMPDIDGALVGGASLNSAQFLKIGMICNQ